MASLTQGGCSFCYRLLLSLLVVCFSWLSRVLAEDVNCILDTTKSSTSPGNYVDCDDEDSSTCCDVDGLKVCCKREEGWSRVKYIAIGVGCATVSLGTVLFIILWCNVEAEPCGDLTRLCHRRRRHPVGSDLDKQREDNVKMSVFGSPVIESGISSYGHVTVGN